MVRARKGNPKLAVAYLRASTTDQKLSPEAQRAAIAAWAAQHGVAIVAEHADLGVSGSAPLEERPGLAAAVATLRTHRAGLLIVLRRDRLARDVAVAALVDRAVRGYGAEVVSADGAGNGDGPADAFMRTVLDGAAAYERAVLRQRTRAALQAKRARGERAGAVPYGYTADAAGRLHEHPGEQATIARARALRATGATVRAIVAALAAEGVVGRTGQPLAIPQVHRLLPRVAAPAPAQHGPPPPAATAVQPPEDAAREAQLVEARHVIDKALEDGAPFFADLDPGGDDPPPDLRRTMVAKAEELLAGQYPDVVIAARPGLRWDPPPRAKLVLSLRPHRHRRA
jgi:DNA invertase Pin-like site-specific DNA recombinase